MTEPSIFDPFRLNQLNLKNRIIKSATSEGMAVDNAPSKRLINWHANLVRGGVAMTTLAYCAVSDYGATFSDQVIVGPSTSQALRHFTDAIHEAGGLACIQLAHCGFFSKHTALGKKPVSPSRTFNKLGAFSGIPFSKKMTVADMERTVGEFAMAARIVKDAGFDAIELHSGHGYLLSQFLSPAFNRRSDHYGGTIEQRLTFPLQVLSAIKSAVGASFPVIIKMNLEDGFKGGLTLDEAVTVARAYEKEGADALVLSGGFTSVSPFYLLRGAIPLKQMIEVEPNWFQKWGVRIFGRMIIKQIPFEEAFFLNQAKRIREAVKLPLVYIGGAASLEGMNRILANGFEMIALGRPLIHDPHFVNKLQSGEVDRTGCTYCNQCIPEIDREGVKCVL